MKNSLHWTSITLFLAASDLSAATRYVSLDSTPAWPYTNWATAARNIQDAVDAATEGDVIRVTKGMYSGGLIVNKPRLRLQSSNGRDFTIVDAAGLWTRCVTVTNADGVSLTGFTLRNGDVLPGSGGGVCSFSTNVCLTNCTLTGNRARGPGGDVDLGGGGGAAGCTLYNCRLISNVVERTIMDTGGGGGAYDCTLYNCTLTGNSVANYRHGSGGGAYGCTLYNCILSDNQIRAEYGGAAYGSLLVNCTLTGNWGGTSPVYGEGAAAVHCTLYNCILYYNNQVNPAGRNYEESSLLFCCTTPDPGGVGNITNAPLFLDYTHGNLRLQSNSPCINAGNNAYVTNSTDLDGNPRIASGTVDIGAYEYEGTGSLISYAWLQQYGLPTDGSADSAHADTDGMNNWQEWICGTCPTNALSALRLLSAKPAGANVTVSWQSVAGVCYFLESSTNLRPPFTPLSSNILGQAGTTTFADTNATGPGPFFYRVGVKSP